MKNNFHANMNLVRILFSFLVIILASGITSGSSSIQEANLEIEIESDSYQFINTTEFQSIFVIKVTALYNYIFIAAINGTIFFPEISNMSKNLLVNDPPDALGLNPNEPEQIQLISEATNTSFSRNDILIAINVHFRLYVTDDENFGKIVTKTAIFNQTTNKIGLTAPFGAIYYSVSFSKETTTTSWYLGALILLLPVTRYFKRKQDVL